MHRERNKETLRQALRQLPVHEPPPQIWTGIAGALEASGAEESRRAALASLPVYAPPPQIWQAIERELEKEAAPPPLRVRRRRAWALAATVALLLTAGALAWQQRQRPAAPVVTVEQSQELLPTPPAPAVDWNADEAAFNEVLASFTAHPLLQSDPAFKSLQAELNELNAAKLEIETMMQRYGRDALLIKQIGAVERARSDVLKALASLPNNFSEES